MKVEFQGKIGGTGFPLVLVELRKAGATAANPGWPVWAIIDTAAASSFIHPDAVETVPGLEACKGPKVSFTTGHGGDEAESRLASLWLPATGGNQPVKLLDSTVLAVFKVRVQKVLIGKDILSRGEQHINWKTGEVRVILEFPD